MFCVMNLATLIISVGCYTVLKKKKVSESVSPEKDRSVYLVDFAPSQYKLLWHLFP